MAAYTAAPLRPPLIKVRSEELLRSSDSVSTPTAPMSPLQRALDHVPTVRLSILEAPDSSSCSPLRRGRRLSIEVVRHRKAPQASVRTNIEVSFRFVLLLLCLLATSVTGFAIGGKSTGLPRHARARAPAVIAPANLEIGAASKASQSRGTSLTLDVGSGLRARIGLVRFCLGAQLKFGDRSGMRNWVLSKASEAACSLAFPVAYGEVRRWRTSRESAAKNALHTASVELEVMLQMQYPGQRFTIQRRYKSASSLFEKLFLRGKSRADDVLGLRIIVEGDVEKDAADAGCAAHCQEVGAMVKSLWAQTGSVKDYITHPKANGYQSLHLCVQLENGAPLEVQIRTRGMHKEAEHGSAAHGAYKLAAAASSYGDACIATA